MSAAALLRVAGLRVAYGDRIALDGVDFELARGETLAVVGESGSGKTTLARALLRLVPADAGSITVAGDELTTMDARRLRALRRRMQIVFQDPLASLDPRMTVADSVAEPLRVHEPRLDRAALRRRVAAMVERVGLAAEHLDRYPHELSGGQCQRVGIARALVVGPELLVCDEPVSALDVSVQAQVVNLLLELQREFGLAMLFIAHDLAVVYHVADRVLVLRDGRVVEAAPRDRLYAAPEHPYTRELLAAIPVAPPRAALQTPASNQKETS